MIYYCGNVPFDRYAIIYTIPITLRHVLKKVVGYILCFAKHDLVLLAGIPSTLIKLLRDKDQFCRLKAAECFYGIASEYRIGIFIVNRTTLSHG
jgi:hypothetical protein